MIKGSGILIAKLKWSKETRKGEETSGNIKPFWKKEQVEKIGNESGGRILRSKKQREMSVLKWEMKICESEKGHRKS